jgi:hypothetical protein
MSSSIGRDKLMPRKADYTAKTLRLTLCAKPGQEDKIRAFKELAARNDLEISDILFEKVEEFLKEHNYPPGNSQTLLSRFDRDLARRFDKRMPQYTCRSYRGFGAGKPYCALPEQILTPPLPRCLQCDTKRFTFI